MPCVLCSSQEVRTNGWAACGAVSWWRVLPALSNPFGDVEKPDGVELWPIALCDPCFKKTYDESVAAEVRRERRGSWIQAAGWVVAAAAMAWIAVYSFRHDAMSGGVAASLFGAVCLVIALLVFAMMGRESEEITPQPSRAIYRAAVQVRQALESGRAIGPLRLPPFADHGRRAKHTTVILDAAMDLESLTASLPPVWRSLLKSNPAGVRRV